METGTYNTPELPSAIDRSFAARSHVTCLMQKKGDTWPLIDYASIFSVIIRHYERNFCLFSEEKAQLDQKFSFIDHTQPMFLARNKCYTQIQNQVFVCLLSHLYWGTWVPLACEQQTHFRSSLLSHRIFGGREATTWKASAVRRLGSHRRGPRTLSTGLKRMRITCTVTQNGVLNNECIQW